MLECKVGELSLSTTKFFHKDSSVRSVLKDYKELSSLKSQNPQACECRLRCLLCRIHPFANTMLLCLLPQLKDSQPSRLKVLVIANRER